MSQPTRFSRRKVLKRGAQLAAGAAAAPYMLTSQALGDESKAAAGNRLGVGFIGVGGMGRGHLGNFVRYPDVQVLAIADVYEKSRQAAQNMVKDAYGHGVDLYNDYRELLARKDIDAVVIGTPDHWHAKTAIDACDAGMDVYCEKPLSLTIAEARAMANAARRNGTIFQTGSQQRSSDNFRLGCELVRSGRIGKLQWVRASIGGGPVIDYQKPVPPPPGLDWDFWLGPARWAEYTPHRCHYDFRWIYDYSGGKMTDWGAHHNDIAQWGIGASYSGPVKTEPVAATFPTKGLFNTATSFEVKHTYANGVVLYTVSHGGNGVFFQGTDGWVEVNRGHFATSDPEIQAEPIGPGDVKLYRVKGDSVAGHERNWLECIKTRQRPICDVEIGCRSVTVCHLGTIAIRTGKTIHWDPEKEVVTNDDSLNRWLDVPYRSPWRL
jgi:predicted dehydrogenase